MPYPAHVKIDHKALDSVKVSLRAAEKSSSLSKQTLFCQCRKSCNTRNCSCRKEGMLCSSHCHRGRGCSNNNFSQLLKSESEKNDPDDPKKKNEKFKRNVVRPAKIEMTAPINGGREGTKTFANTCPIDGWLFLLRLIADAYPETIGAVIVNFGSSQPMITSAFRYCKIEEYDLAKSVMAEVKYIEAKRNCYNFHGNEQDLFIKHLSFLFAHSESSHCDSPF